MQELGQPLAPAEQSVVCSWARRAADLLDELAPDCPKAMAAAAQLLSTGIHTLNQAAGHSRRPSRQQVAELSTLQVAVNERYRRGWEGAQQRGSDLHMATVGLNWLIFAGACAVLQCAAGPACVAWCLNAAQAGRAFSGTRRPRTHLKLNNPSLLPAANNPQSQDQGLIEAVIAAGPEAVQALKRCKRTLPDTWTAPLQEVAG